MKANCVSRRRFMTCAGAAVGTIVTTAKTGIASENASSGGAVPFRYCFNTSTIRGQKLSLDKEITVTAEAGYSAIEPWVD